MKHRESVNQESSASTEARNKGRDWVFRGFCLNVPKQKDIELFKRLIAEVLPAYQCNTLVLLTRYQYQFQSHPAVRDGEPLTLAQAAEIASLCKAHNVRIIPKMNLLGHQSGRNKGSELGLLRAFPEFDETPQLSSVRYCRSLCPRHPQVKDVVFELADELIDAFGADAIHVGLDEVFEIGKCSRCKETSNGELFAEWVTALHDHLVGEKKVEMLMWSDRLLDSDAMGYGEWEASANDTHTMIDEIPKDIIMCDWHYGEREEYPSIPFFADKGFRHIVCPWKELKATEALLSYASSHQSEKFLGVLQTSWCDSGMIARYLCDADDGVTDIPQLVGNSFRHVMGASGNGLTC